MKSMPLLAAAFAAVIGGGASAAELELVRNSKPQFAIVGRFAEEAAVRGPEGQTLKKFKRDSVRLAADTLVEAFSNCCGFRPEVLEETDEKAARHPYVIALGRTRYSERLGLDGDKLPREGFAVKTFDRGVVITGMDGFRIPGFYDRFNWRCGRITCNGTLLGAVDFVEKQLGVRKLSIWLGKDYHVFPKRGDLVVGALDYSDWPRTWFRAGHNNEGWRVATSTDFFGGEFPHPYDMAKAHPDKIETIFFRDRDGLLHQDSGVYSKNFFDITNPDFADILIDDFVRYYEQDGKGTFIKDLWNPSTHYMWFGQCDRNLQIDNERTKDLQRENPRLICDSRSEIYGRFYEYLAEKAAAKLPGRRLVLMAYSNYLRAPRKVKRYPDNVQILACIGTPALAASDAYMHDVIECYEEWNALCSNKCVPYLYHLCYKGGGPIPQLMHGYFMGEFLRKVRPYTDSPLYYPCFGHSGKENPLGAYMTYAASWNPEVDPSAVAEDYLVNLFGKKSGHILHRFCDRLRDLWLQRYIPEVAKGHYVGNGTRSIPQLQHEAMYVKMLDASTIAKLTKALELAEAALPDDATKRKLFRDFADPYLASFKDATAYQSMKIIDFDLGRRNTRLPGFKRAYIDDGTKVVSPEVLMRWDDQALYLTAVAPAPYKIGRYLWDGDTYELFLAPGDMKPVNRYQFVMASNGSFEDMYSQIDPPRPNDPKWVAKGAVYKVNTDVKYRGIVSNGTWRAELKLPWSALFDKPPKKGEIWRMNLISNRSDKGEYSSIAPTLKNNFRWEFYTRMKFTD